MRKPRLSWRGFGVTPLRNPRHCATYLAVRPKPYPPGIAFAWPIAMAFVIGLESFSLAGQ